MLQPHTLSHGRIVLVCVTITTVVLLTAQQPTLHNSPNTFPFALPSCLCVHPLVLLSVIITTTTTTYRCCHFRWYLPTYEPRHVLPLQFDYSARSSQAEVWLPLLKPTPMTESLSPPPKPYTAAAAGLRGFLAPSSSFARRRTSALGGFGQAAANSHRKGGDNSVPDSWWGRISGASRRRRRAAARAAAAEAAAVMHDVGNGVAVPEGDWLVPLRGETQLSVELEMPPWPEPDMVHVSV